MNELVLVVFPETEENVVPVVVFFVKYNNACEGFCPFNPKISVLPSKLISIGKNEVLI